MESKFVLFCLLVLIGLGLIDSFQSLRKAKSSSPSLLRDNGSRTHYSAEKVLRKLAAGFLIAFTTNQSIVSALPEARTTTVKNLEETIVQLETAPDRATTVQALADVFEAAGAKTLLARTRYKYVSSLTHNRTIHSVYCSVYLCAEDCECGECAES